MNLTLATYIHDLGPFLLQFTDNIGIRWYGFMYVLGFLGAFLLFRWFWKLKASELHESKVADFITIVAFLGIMLGGRLGYIIIYNEDPTFGEKFKSFFKFLEGGMASHGAIFMALVVVFIYARYQKLSWLNLGDNLVICGTLGVFFGRLGNFINGELYGRVTTHPWAMKFPLELYSLPNEVEKLRTKLSPEQAVLPLDKLIELSRKNPELKEMIGQHLSLRHPSQIYQALCEGLLVCLICLAIRLKWKNAYHGLISGIFFISYSIARITVENFREPDSERMLDGLVTKGQFYSFFMFATGIALIIWAMTNRRQNQIPKSTPAKEKR